MFRKSKQQIALVSKSSMMKKMLDPNRNRPLSRQLQHIMVAIVALAVLSPHNVKALRQCLQPTPMAETTDQKSGAAPPSNNPFTLSSSSSCKVPQIPTHIWHQTPCHMRTNKQLVEDTRKNITTGIASTDMPPSRVDNTTCCTIKDVCTVIAHALLADYGLLDAVFLPPGSCRGDIFAGNFTRQDAARVVAPDIGLVVLQLNGSELVQVLEDAVFMGLSSSSPKATASFADTTGATVKKPNTTASLNMLPAVAGIECNLRRDAPYGSRVSNAIVLSPFCEWQPVDPHGHYTILTTHELVRALPSMQGKVNTDLQLLFRGNGQRHGTTVSDGSNSSQWRLQDALWLHAKSACTIQDPFMRGKTCQVPSKSPLPKMCRNSPFPDFASKPSNQQVLFRTYPNQPIASSGRGGVQIATTGENKKKPKRMMKPVNHTQTAKVPTIVVLKKGQ